jgi:VWFA-related protein
MLLLRRVLVIVVLAVVSGPAASGQFRAGTALVLVDVVATRLDGNLARDLKSDDFLVFEDGRPQPIRQFQVVDLEAEQDSTPPPGVFSNQAAPGAVFALVLDDMMIEPRHTGRLRRAAQQFVDEEVRPGDFVGVMRSGADSPLLLTTDRDMVRPVITQASGRYDPGDLSALTGLSGSTVPLPGGDAPQMPDFSALGLVQGTPGRIPSLVMLQRVVEYLAAIPARRKAVLFFSQGVPFDLEAFSTDSQASQFETARQVLAAAREGNVAIYTIDPRGLEGVQDASLGAAPSGTGRDAAIDSLRDLASATGGRAVVSTNELTPGLARISRENRFYYLIGYEPADTTTARNRAWQIDVRTRAPGVTLLHRRAYAPSTAAAIAAAAKRTAIASPLPVADLGITLAPVIFPDPGGGASLAVPFEIGGALARNTTVKYSVVAVNSRGVLSAPVSGTVRTTDGLARGMVRLKLAPGRYQLRLHAEADDVAGVAMANVHMLEPNREAPSCGGFMLLQPAGGSPRPNVTRRMVRTQPVMAAMVVSARADLARAAMALVARRPGVTPDVEIPVSRPQRIAAGVWRIEGGIPAGTFSGDVEVTLLLNEEPIDNCRAELRFE